MSEQRDSIPHIAKGSLQGRKVKLFPKDSIKTGSQNKDVDGCVMLFLIPVYIVAAIAGLFEVIFTGGKSHCCWDGMSGTQSTKGGL
jgi:hypothetical protein